MRNYHLRQVLTTNFLVLRSPTVVCKGEMSIGKCRIWLKVMEEGFGGCWGGGSRVLAFVIACKHGKNDRGMDWNSKETQKYSGWKEKNEIISFSLKVWVGNPGLKQWSDGVRNPSSLPSPKDVHLAHLAPCMYDGFVFQPEERRKGRGKGTTTLFKDMTWKSHIFLP